MNRVLTASSLFAASLALIPSASQAEEAHFMNVMDVSAINEKTAELFGIRGYDGPVVIVQARGNEELEFGYVAAMSFSESNLGPIATHPMLELVDAAELEGVPMFLTDRIDRFGLVEDAELQVNPHDVAGVIDMQWAADDVFDQLQDGIGEGDYLIVTHGPPTTAGSTEDGVLSQEVYAAHVFDPQGASSEAIEKRAGVPYAEGLALVILYSEEDEIASGFEMKTKAIWVQNGPDAADQSDSNADADENEDGEVGGADSETQEEQSQSEGVTDGRSLELPGNLGGSMDLPEFTPSPRGPVRDAATFAPATHRAVYRR